MKFRTNFKSFVSVVVLTSSLTACQNQVPGSNGNGQLLGTLGGAGLGGLVGSQLGKGSGKLAFTGAGVLLGALAGNAVGQSLDRADVAYANQTTNQALESAPIGQATTWRNPDNGNYGTITPVRTYPTAGGQYCREYTQTIYVGGQQQQAYGTACRQPDGSWAPAS